jgi:prepilin-type N-terminal cleavage/methylation domain-containing protein
MTLIEVLVALVVLSIGVLALTGSSAMINRMIGRGGVETHAALLASQRLEQLRELAASTTPRCTSANFASGGPHLHESLLESWTVAPAGRLRRVSVSVSYLTIRGSRSAVLETEVAC